MTSFERYAQIREWMLSGRLTAEEGAMLMALVDELRKLQRPWWVRLVDWLIP